MSSASVRKQQALQWAIDDSKGQDLHHSQVVQKAEAFEAYLSSTTTPADEKVEGVDMFKVFAAFNEAGLFGDDIMKANDELEKRGIAFRNIKAE